MEFKSINPATGQSQDICAAMTDAGLAVTLSGAHAAGAGWRMLDIRERAGLLVRAACVLRDNQEEFAQLMTLEMGKPIGEARAEIEKSALGCEYYAENGPGFLADEVIASDAGRSLVCYQPLGTVLAIMPWNFPFWQVFRFAAPALVAGNTCLLKHASSVPQCALAIQTVFEQAGFPEFIFSTLTKS